jgi:putative spermidine/putrescine transport system substrate-binding protein
MDRRTFLQTSFKTSVKTAAALTFYPSIALAASGCQGQGADALRLMALRGTVPLQLPKQFKQSEGRSVDLKQVRQLRDLFLQLQQWKRQSTGEVKTPKGLLPWPVPLVGTPAEASAADLVTIGDYWLTLAIRQKLLRPIDVDKIPTWQTLDPKIRELVKRNDRGELAADGQVWAMPYRINSTVLLYRKDIFAEKKLPLPTDWKDLWRSDLKGRISLLDQPREVIGVALRSMDLSGNTQNLSDVQGLKENLALLHHNAKFYSSTHYLQPLTLEQTWLAMASSTDALGMMRRNPKLAAVFPASGSLLNADLWVQPALAEKAEISETTNQTIAAWLDYSLNADRAIQVSKLIQGMSPSLTQVPIAQVLTELQSAGLVAGKDWFARSEFLLPQPEKVVEQWRSMWEVMRND